MTAHGANGPSVGSESLIIVVFSVTHAQPVQEIAAYTCEGRIGNVARTTHGYAFLVSNDAIFHHQDAISEENGLFYVMGDQKDGTAVRLPQFPDQILCLDTRKSVERSERLVKQKQIGLAYQGAGK
jgi:hypothetical protein